MYVNYAMYILCKYEHKCMLYMYDAGGCVQLLCIHVYCIALLCVYRKYVCTVSCKSSECIYVYVLIAYRGTGYGI